MPVLRRNIVIALSVIYVVGLVIFTKYWGDNFSKSVHKKGEEFNLFLIVLIVSTYLLYLIAGWVGKRIRFVLLIFLPLTSIIGAFIVGFILLALVPLGGRSKDIMFIFMGCYTVLNLFGLYITTSFALGRKELS